MRRTFLHTIFLGSALVFSALSFGQGLWIKKASFPGDARHRCTGFSIGNKGYVGGGHINSGFTATYDDYWEYDPSTDSWTQIADYGGGARYHAAAFTIGNAAYVGGGENATHEYKSDFWKYVPLVNTWFPVADLPGNPRRGSTSFVINDTGYVGLGQSDFGYEVDFYKYDIAEDEWIQVADFIGSARSGAVGFENGDNGYVATGHELGAATRDFFTYHAPTDSWTQLADVDTTFRQDASGFTLLGKGYVFTGNDNDGTKNYRDVWEYDFTAGTWTKMAKFPGAARRYFVSFVIGDKGYGVGGTDGTNLKDTWEFDPTTSSISNSDIIELNCYPNPAITNLRIDYPNELGDVTVEVHSLQGQLVKVFNIEEGSSTINISDLMSGTFVVSILNEQGVLGRKTIIKK